MQYNNKVFCVFGTFSIQMNKVHFSAIYTYIMNKRTMSYNIRNLRNYYKIQLFSDVHCAQCTWVRTDMDASLKFQNMPSSEAIAIYFNKLARIQFKFGYSENSVQTNDCIQLVPPNDIYEL